MKISRKYLLTAGVLLVTLALPSRSLAAPGQTFHFKLRGPLALAFFDNVEGCVETTALVQAQSTVGTPGTTQVALVQISQVDNCSLAMLLSAAGAVDLPPGAFQSKRNLMSATLNTSVDVFDSVSNTTFPVNISLNWVGTGELTVSRFHDMFRSPGFKDNSMFTGDSRAATASGSMTALGMNFSPDPAEFAELDFIKQGDESVTH